MRLDHVIPDQLDRRCNGRHGMYAAHPGNSVLD
jgi:hypothetical protein